MPSCSTSQRAAAARSSRLACVSMLTPAWPAGPKVLRVHRVRFTQVYEREAWRDGSARGRVHGFPGIACLLSRAGASPNIANQELETPLHCAAARGHLSVVRCLLDSGALCDTPDSTGATALHLALRRRHQPLAHLLLEAGASCDVADHVGERPIHIACAEGLLAAVQALCTYGCTVDVANNEGLYPVHLAARNGHTEVPCCADTTTSACLLSRLSNSEVREEFISQLVPSANPISRIKLKLFGNSGVGKTALVDSLKAGYFSGFFRRSKSSSDALFPQRSSRAESGACWDSTMSVRSSSRHFTRGINITQATLSGVGEVSLWDFSGHPDYRQLYDQFVGSADCLHLVLYRLCDPAPLRLQQVVQWLGMLQACIAPLEPFGHCGRSVRPARVVLVATHADLVRQRRDGHGQHTATEMEMLMKTVRQRFGTVFDLSPMTFILDATSSTSPSLKHLRAHLARLKTRVTQGLPKSTGFLETMVAQVGSWRRLQPHFPIMTWADLVEVVRDQVNPLAGEEHVQEVVQQLQLMGEVVHLAAGAAGQDLVALAPRWLCGDVLGLLFSPDFRRRTKATGCYTVREFQMLMPQCDALDLLQVLETLHLCAQCDNDGDIEYEFSCYNRVAAVDGVWDVPPSVGTKLCYGGVLLRRPPAAGQLTAPLLPRLQVQLRCFAQEYAEAELELYQWSDGSKLCADRLEALLTPSADGRDLELKVRGPADARDACFYLMEDLLSALEQVFAEVSPGLLVERHYLSPSDLRRHLRQPQPHPAQLLDAVCWPAELAVCCVPAAVRQRLCAALDPADALGRDWCLLAVQLGLTERLARLDAGDNPAVSRTARLLAERVPPAGDEGSGEEKAVLRTSSGSAASSSTSS
ncbi:death-associated protein kinase dapk-1-like [Pollicipes pollicipes]|uniref:death-associated protein kinase dapk-1-like n=1 Tax=Pollicipes pollicipes TaxID=41117 RepID=UPI001884E451|nr:death-associated protein kinase dapk-1-like [Pollicipes pollicipes]